MKAGQIVLSGAVAFGLLSATAAWGAPVQGPDDSTSGLPAHARVLVAQDTTATMPPKEKPHHHPAVVVHRKHHPHPLMRKKPATTTGEHPTAPK
jgi:hypothetical protein